MSAYPEHDKMAAIQKESQAIGEFIDTGPYHLAEWVHFTMEGYDSTVVTDRSECEEFGEKWCRRHHIDRLMPVQKPITRILAEYFGIDLDKIEDEKVAMLEELRQANA